MKKTCHTCYNNKTTPYIGFKPPPPNAKVGGFDFTVQGFNARHRHMLSKEARLKMEELEKKQKRKEKHEMYVKTLHMEADKVDRHLKLQREKELDQTQGILQMDKFFSDGVAINNNILTMKS